jgi:SPP1 gp7 family putative phage head morphogenesis protein
MSEDDPGEFDAVESLPLNWSPLVKLIRPGLVVVAVDAGGEALDALGLFDDDVKSLMTEAATKVAAARAAEMVGMKFVDGELKPNPDAKWRIDEATRDMVRATATTAVKEGWSNQRLATELKDDHAFSAERAENIARTETARAQIDGAIAGWKTSGVVGGRQWKTAEDCCDICQELDGEIVALDEDFDDGDPPLHPSCRCDLQAVLIDDMPEEEPENGYE